MPPLLHALTTEPGRTVVGVGLVVPGLGRLYLRDPRPDDRRYVGGCVYHTMCQTDRYRDRPGLERRMDDAMARWDDGPETSPLRLVAHLPEEPDVIVAFMAADPGLRRLDHLNVRPGFRGLGVARALVDLVFGSGPIAVSLDTPDLSRLRPLPARELPAGLLHNPHYRLHLVEGA